MKLVLQHNKFYVESPDSSILRKLLKDPVIQAARVLPAAGSGDELQVLCFGIDILVMQMELDRCLKLSSYY